MLHEKPGPLVLRLVLAPHHVSSIRVLFQLGGEDFVRERIELFHAQDGHIIQTLLFALFNQVVVHLARAGNHTLDFVALKLFALGNHGLEGTLGELRQRRGRVLITQQALRGHDDQGLTQIAHHLAT